MPRINVEYHSGIPVYRQIINSVTSALASGEIGAVAKAYRELELTGVVASAGRNGTVVTGLPSKHSRPSRSEKEIKLKEIYARVMAEARALGISEKELARIFSRGENDG